MRLVKKERKQKEEKTILNATDSKFGMCGNSHCSVS